MFRKNSGLFPVIGNDNDTRVGHEVPVPAIFVVVKPNDGGFGHLNVLVDDRPPDAAVAAYFGVGQQD